jgi:hypothetical protein
MRLRDFKPEDLVTIKAIEPFAENPQGWEEVIENSIAITAEVNGEPIACGGVVVGKEAVFWARSSGKCKTKIYRGLKEGLRILTESLGDMVYSAIIADEFEMGDRLARRLGFRKTDMVIEYHNHTYHRYRLWL